MTDDGTPRSLANFISTPRTPDRRPSPLPAERLAARSTHTGCKLSPVNVSLAAVSFDTDIDYPHMRTPPARIAAAAPAT